MVSKCTGLSWEVISSMSQGMFVQRLANHRGRVIDARPKLSDFEGQGWAHREAEEAESFEAPFKPKRCACVITHFSVCRALHCNE